MTVQREHVVFIGLSPEEGWLRKVQGKIEGNDFARQHMLEGVEDQLRSQQIQGPHTVTLTKYPPRMPHAGRRHLGQFVISRQFG